MADKIRALAVIPGEKESAHLIEVDRPKISPREVLVRVRRVGVCGTDHEINQGLYGEAPPGERYLVLGHESLGVVAEVGGDVKGFEPGDLVVASVRRPCPETCLNCRAGESDMCLTENYRERGIKGMHGFMREYYKEAPEYLVKVPRELAEVAVLLEPLSIVEKAVEQAFKIQERLKWEPEKALVLGAGPIGLLATFVLRDRGLETYTLARKPRDSIKARLAEESGAHYIDSTREPIPGLPDKLGNIDLIFEATGSSTVAFQAMGILGVDGVLALTGISGGSKKLTVEADCLNMCIVLGNKAIFGSVSSNMHHFRQGVRHLRRFEARWPGLAGRLITGRVPLEDFRAAFRKEGIKTVIEFGGG